MTKERMEQETHRNFRWPMKYHFNGHELIFLGGLTLTVAVTVTLVAVILTVDSGTTLPMGNQLVTITPPPPPTEPAN